MRFGLDTRTLGEIFEVETGSTPSTHVPDYWEPGSIRWITPLDLGRLTSPFIADTSRTISEKGLKNSSAALVPAGSVVISTRAPIGYIAILNQPMAFNQGCKALLPKDGYPVDPLYIYYQLITKVAEMNRLGSGSTFKEISKEKLKSIRIQLPTLPVQKQISAILEKADAAREKRRQANKLTELFLQSAFLEMFGDPVTNPKGWDKVEAGNLFDIKLGKMLDKKRFTGKNRRPYLRNVNVKWNDFDLRVIKTMDFEPDEFEKNKLCRGDILVCEGGEVGRCAIWEEQIPECGYQKALHRLRVVNPIIDSRYFVSFMKLAATHGMLTRDTSQVTIAHFTAEKFQEFKILVPPMDKQNAFSALVKKIESLRAKQRESERELDNLFNVLMQKAFKGELVRDTVAVAEPRRFGLSSTDLHVGLLGKIIMAHEARPEHKPTLGHVKGEKICHVIENFLDLDLGRNPVRMAAGPADFKHLLTVESRASKTNRFQTLKRKDDEGRKYIPRKNMGFFLSDFSAKVGEAEKEMDRVIASFLPMKTEHAEVVATVYAAWNDLLLDGKTPTDDEIVKEARENWTPEKLKIPGASFQASTEWLRRHDLVPKGTGKHTAR